MEFIYGIGMGIVISLCFSFGPAFFTLLQLSVQHGFRKAMPFVFGISCDDILIVLLLCTVLRGVDMAAVLAKPAVATTAGLALLGFGMWTFKRRVESREGLEQHKALNVRGFSDKPVSYWLRGFFINFLNPGIWLYWLGIITLAGGKLGIADKALLPYFAGVLATTLSLDLLKCKAASLLQRVLTPRHINRFNQIVGIILMGFGTYLIGSMLADLI
ncbi:MAG: LysE family transporter [Bacteroidales bacterium]|nr:LysE family transporter [Bacteroidales bacterium]